MQLNKAVVSYVLALLSFASVTYAQEATITGRVVDSSGASVPGASVLLRNIDTSIANDSFTNNDGLFGFPSTRPGNYELTVSLEGFAPFALKGLRLEVGDNRNVAVTLAPGRLEETVTVNASATRLATARAERSVVVENTFVTSIPLNIRNPLQMINNAVGVTPASADSGNNNVSQSRSNTFRINGAKASTTDIQLDGAANITAYANQAAAVPQVDAVQEFRVITAGYAPEYGRTSGGLALFGLRSGTNQMHGTLHEFTRSERFDANGFNANRASQQKQDFSRNQYGFTFGGPVRLPGYDGRDRSFLFVGFEALRETKAGSYTGSVPTALQRVGDFSQTYDARGNLMTIFDPRTTRLDPARPSGTTRYIRDAFPGNRIPAEMLSPIALRILSYYPMPNQPGDGASSANNYYSNAPSGLDTDRIDTRFDHSITDAHRMALRFNFFQNRIRNPDVYGNGMTLIANNRIPGINTMARHTWIAGSSMVVEHHFSFAQSQSNRTSGNLSFDPTSLGFPQSVIAGNPVTTFPLVTANGVGQVGTQVALERNASKVFQYLASVSWLHGRHMFKTGVDMRSYPIRLSSAAQLTIKAANNFTGGPNPQAAVAASGSGVADLLLGAASVSNGIIDADYINHGYYAAYAQDEFRLNPKLTLTYGLRYNLELPWTERDGQLVNLDLESPSPIAALVPQLDLKGGAGFVDGGAPTQNASKTDFDPRIGAAYQVNSKTVLHAGAGIFHHPAPSFLGTGTSIGSSRTTTSVVTEADTVTPLFNLANPFPTGLLEPIGNSQGLSTLLGRQRSATR